MTNAQGKRQMIVIETTTCPSGQKSMPGLNEETADGYHQLIKARARASLAEPVELSLLEHCRNHLCLR